MAIRTWFAGVAGAITSAACAFGAAPAHAAIDPDQAAAVFAEADAICARDAGRFWGLPLCGPILLVDPNDRTVLANQADAGGVLRGSGHRWTGSLPDAVNIANTPTEWSGVRWTMLMWPLYADQAHRRATLAHELFHRIQPQLKLIRDEGGNGHLDTLDGRWLLQLEWRALAAALQAPTPAARTRAIADALLFRAERYRLFPQAAADEGKLEINEGIAEYTGVRLGLEGREVQRAYAVRDLGAFVDAPTFVRSFAYATGPAWGLLLDDLDPRWRPRFVAGQRFDQIAAAALKAQPAGDLKARAAAYDDGTLRARETARDAARRARLADLQRRLVDGPVLVLPLHHVNYQFNPQTIQPLPPYGAVYPTARLSDEWGVLEVESGGVLMDGDMRRAAVSAPKAKGTLQGEGWTLTLKEGWSAAPGPRPGDLVLQRAETPGR